MKTNKLFLVAALLGTVLAGCQKVSEVQNPEEKPGEVKVWTLKVQAVKDVDTRALNYSGNTMKPYWQEEEKVDVYLGGEIIGTLAVTAVSDAGTATLEGTVSADNLEAGSSLYLLFPNRPDGAWTYLGQNGTLPEPFDYASATLEIASLDSSTHTITVTSDEAHFVNQQNIYRFSFKVGNDAITVKSFIVASDEEQIVRSMGYEDGNWYPVVGNLFVNTSLAEAPYLAAIRNGNANAERYTFSVVGNDDALYLGDKSISSGVVNVNSQFLSASITVAKKAFTPEEGTITADNEVL